MAVSHPLGVEVANSLYIRTAMTNSHLLGVKVTNSLLYPPFLATLHNKYFEYFPAVLSLLQFHGSTTSEKALHSASQKFYSPLLKFVPMFECSNLLLCQSTLLYRLDIPHSIYFSARVASSIRGTTARFVAYLGILSPHPTTSVISSVYGVKCVEYK